jgi:predicted lipoprotein with Yx(FWY)xxD motif
MRFINIRTVSIVAVAAFALAACGSSSKAATTPDTTTATVAPDTTTVPAATTTTAAPAADASVKLATTSLGSVLVDAKGMTLYRFDADTVAGKSACGTGCDTTWPAATVTGAATAGTGIDASKLTTFTRDDGAKQLQIDGHPLYTFSGDAKAGDTKGQGIITKWWVVGAAGDEIKTAA